MSGALLSMVLGPGKAVQVTTASTGALGSRLIGFKPSSGLGSVTPTADPIYHDTLTGIYWDESLQTFYLTEAGSDANSGWAQIAFGSHVFTRASATYLNSGGTSWSWPQATPPWAGGSMVTVAWS